MKISVPHIHKIEGDIGLWAEVTKQGKVESLKMQGLIGLRQIEGILIGRKVEEAPVVISRICGICPVVHILNAICAFENALSLKVSPLTILLRKLMLASQIIQSNALHLFFMSLPDFFNIENDLDLLKKFPKEADAAMKVRDYALDITKVVGIRAVHPLTFKIGGFRKMPDKEKLKKLLESSKLAIKNALILEKTLKKVSYPKFERKINFASLYSKKEYPFYQADLIKIKDEEITIKDFYSNELIEDLKQAPIKKVKFRGEEYMLGSIARVKNNNALLNPIAKRILEDFVKEQGIDKEKMFDNIFYNLFYQFVEVVHFIEETEKIIKQVLIMDLNEKPKLIKMKQGTGLTAMEAPRGTLFDFMEIDKNGRVLNCNIITPSAQFLNNLEKDIKLYLPKIIKMSEKERARKIRSLARVYDPCISCATH
ncbi:MAG: nickel-dependent hydrogenase large subunit [Candidatus Nealsonbacteria bacterium]